MVPTIKSRSGQLILDHSSLLALAIEETFLTSDNAAAATTLTVRSIDGFAINQVLFIGEYPSEDAVIVKTHASTAPNSTTLVITLTAALSRAYPTGTRIRVIPYDQFVLYRSTTDGGTKTALTLNSGVVSISPDDAPQRYNEAEFSSGYYICRYKNSIGTTYSDYSDYVLYGSDSPSSVGYVIGQALKRIGKTFSEKLTKEFFYNEINECLRKIKGKQLRWPEHAEEDYVAGQTARGTNKITLPTDIYDVHTNKSITGVRIGTGTNLTYLDPRTFEDQKVSVAYTQVRTQATAAAITLEIDNSYDFADSGSVNTYISNVKYPIIYTGVTRSATAGILTGIATDQITVTTPVDTNVWQNETEGQPLYFTVRDGELEYWPIPDASYDNMNIYLDYDKVATAIDSDGDTIDFQRYGMVLDYITWKAEAMAKSDGKLDMNSAWYFSFKESLNDAIKTKMSGKKFRWVPHYNKMSRN